MSSLWCVPFPHSQLSYKLKLDSSSTDCFSCSTGGKPYISATWEHIVKHFLSISGNTADVNAVFMKIRTSFFAIVFDLNLNFLYRAEYVLEVIGAGSITKSARNWHDIWLKSQECTALGQELEKIHQEGRTRPFIHSESESRFPTPWGYQFVELLKRGMLDYYRNATYLSSKLALNVICGLFVGFSFFKKEESLQGTQDKVFVSTFLYSFFLVMVGR